MVSKILLTLSIVGLIFFNSLFYTKHNENNHTNAILFANPLLFKALSGPLHNLIADKLWLLSNSVSEMGVGGSNAVNSKEFVAATKTIVTMDPYFYAPVNYAATYLVSINKDIVTALEFLRLARYFDDKNFKLYFNELIFLLTYADDYNYKVDYDYVIELAKKTEALPIEDKQIGAMLVGNWIDDFIISANSKMNRRAQAIDDLVWLYEQTDDDVRKVEIKKRITELQNEK